MTVPYNLDVSSVNSHTWIKLFFRWRGSIWKSVCNELLIWLFLYYVVMFVYRSDYILDVRKQEYFERIAAHWNERVTRLPLTFMLGFFVTLVVDRWRQIFTNMGWIENSALTVASLIRGSDPDTTLIRRSIVRYMVLSQVLVFRDISMSVRRRFPTMKSIVQAGFIMEHELAMLEEAPIDEKYNKYWVPINWACVLVHKTRLENHITTEPSPVFIVNTSYVNYVLNEIKNFRTSLALLCNFDWVPIPLAYPQVVFLAVRVYFLICLVSRQFIVGPDSKYKSQIDMYFPLMTVLEFIFMVGWMKTGLAIVDDTYDKHPPLIMDHFKANQLPIYSEDSQKHGHNNPLIGSTANVELAPKEEEVKMVEVDLVSNADSTDTRFAQSLTTARLRKKLSDSISFKRPRVRSTSLSTNSAAPTPTSIHFPSRFPSVTSNSEVNFADRRNDHHTERRPERPFELSFSPSILASDTVREVDEEQLTIGKDGNPPYKPHTIAGRISEGNEDEATPLDDKAAAPQKSSVPSLERIFEKDESKI